MNEKKPKTKSDFWDRRNTKNVGFSEDEYKEIVAKAKKKGIYPRQYIMLLVREPEK